MGKIETQESLGRALEMPQNFFLAPSSTAFIPCLPFPLYFSFHPVLLFNSLKCCFIQGCPLSFKCLPTHLSCKALGFSPKAHFFLGQYTFSFSLFSRHSVFKICSVSMQTHKPRCSLLGRSCCSMSVYFFKGPML